MGADALEKRSISFVLREPGGSGRVLAVQRPPDDEDLPNAWGLPAGSLREGESWQDAVRRAGREKLNVEVEPVRVLREGALERRGRRLRMRLYEARVVAGAPTVPGRARDVTQYAAWEWAEPERFRPAAQQGSLCCRLWLDAAGLTDAADPGFTRG